MGNNVIEESLADNLETFMKAVVPHSYPGDMYMHATTLISLDDILPPWHHALEKSRVSQLGGLRTLGGGRRCTLIPRDPSLFEQGMRRVHQRCRIWVCCAHTHVLLHTFLHPSRLLRCWRGLGTSAWSLPSAQRPQGRGREEQGELAIHLLNNPSPKSQV